MNPAILTNPSTRSHGKNCRAQGLGAGQQNPQHSTASIARSAAPTHSCTAPWAQHYSCHRSLMHNSLCLLSPHIQHVASPPSRYFTCFSPLLGDLRNSLIPSITPLQERKLSLSDHYLPFADVLLEPCKEPMGRVRPFAQCPALRGPEHHLPSPPWPDSCCCPPVYASQVTFSALRTSVLSPPFSSWTSSDGYLEHHEHVAVRNSISMQNPQERTGDGDSTGETHSGGGA